MDAALPAVNILTFIGISSTFFAVNTGLISLYCLVAAGFKKHLAWGLANLCLPGAILVFFILYWEYAKEGVQWFLGTAALLAVSWLALGSTLFSASNRKADALQQPYSA